MVAFERAAGPEYKCKVKLVELSEVANKEKKIPLEWIDENGTGLKQEFIDYALPLIQGESSPPMVDGLPRFAKLKKVWQPNRQSVNKRWTQSNSPTGRATDRQSRNT